MFWRLLLGSGLSIYWLGWGDGLCEVELLFNSFKDANQPKAKFQNLLSATTKRGEEQGEWEGHWVVVLEKQIPEKISPCSKRTKLKFCQNFTQSRVGNELQIPEMGKIPFLSRHRALSSINKHMIAVTKANLVVTQGPLAQVWVFSLDLRVSSLL